METVYLDTHIAMWIYFGEKESISSTAQRVIENASQLYISPIMNLELQYLKETDRISVPPNQILSLLSSEFGIHQCHKKFSDVMVESLLHRWTRDPFDRIITAQASIDQSILVTKDRSILKNYPKAIWE